MSSNGQVQLKKVWKMLNKCADGHKAIEQQHLWRIEFQGRTFPSLPIGRRKVKVPEVQLGIVRKMVRHLQLDEKCVRRHLPQI